MIYKLQDKEAVEPLFRGWEETMIYSCLQGVMGEIYVTDTKKPQSACAAVGCFAFFAGRPDAELIKNRPDGSAILVPQNAAWGALTEQCIPGAVKVTRYAMKKNTVFRVPELRRIAAMIPDGYELRNIDGDVYDKCLEDPATADFVAAFADKKHYLRYGRGVVVMKGGRIVSGASSYTRYREGIEIEVDTIKEERRKGLAFLACASLILQCLSDGLYPSWDAQNKNSVCLAEKLGYEYAHDYTAYEVM